jgi:gliding motility-associated-like protein
MKKHLLTLLSILFISQLSITQTQFANITVTVESVTHNDQCGCNDQGFFQCGIANSQPDPRWNIRSRVSSGAFSPTTFIQYDDQNCTTSSRSDVLNTYNSECDDLLIIETESWEEDDSPNSTFNGSDDNYSGLETFAINYQLDPASTLNTYTFNLANGYSVQIGVFWTVSTTVGAPSVSGTTSLCSGDNLSLTAFEPSATNYNWYTAPSGGTPDFTGANFTVSNVTSNISYYVAGSIGACEGPRTQVDITVETAPNAGTGAGTTICDSQNAFDLFSTLAGNDIGGTWNDDNGTGALTGSNFDATGLGGGAYDFTYTVTGTICPNDNETVTITVETSPNAGIATNTTICNSVSLFDLFSTLTGNDAGGTWNDDNGTGALSVNFFDATSVLAGTYDFTYTVTGTTCSSSFETVSITVDEISTDPTSLTALTPSICAPGPVDFNVVGGSLGTGAQWELYSGAGACGTTLEGTSLTGTFTGINVTNTENYFVLASGSCNSTNCASATVTLETTSTDPSGSTVSNSTICAGDPITLQVGGGSLGTGATWEWYEGTCGGTPVGSGPIIVLNPTVSTDYFVRAEGFCGITNCDTISVTVTPAPIPIDSALASIYTICPEDPVQLNAYYSSTLPAGYSITWYTGACGAVPVGVGDSIVVNPTDTTIYYVQCVGTCGVSACDTVVVNVLDGSISPTSITASNNNFCSGGATILSVNGGSLVSGAQWTWYEGSCGGTAIGSGNSINVSPTVSTMYYVRGTGGSCGNTQCATIFINVFDLNVYLTPFDTVCIGNTGSFILTGGFPTGGTYTGNGVVSGIFDPVAADTGTHAITYSYTDGNGCSASSTENIVVLESNPAPISINASALQICNGASTNIWLDSLSNVLIPGRMWVWYEGACGGGIPIDTTYNDINLGDTLITVSPTTTTNYYVRAESGICDPSQCIGVTIDVYNLETDLLSFDDVCGVDVPAFNLSGGIPSGGTFSGTGVSNDIFDPLIADTGTHLITYTYVFGGCTATDSEPITVNSSPINVSYTLETESCSEGGVLIHVHSTEGSGFYSYSWSDGSVNNPLTYAQPGDYTVLVSDANDCTTLLGPISISEDLACIEMSNTFTPNGDGTNDTWNLDFSSYGSAHLTIFSKWGKLVREFNEVNIQWDGIYEGEPLPAGTYYYVLELGSGVVQNGPITIVR